MNNQRSNRPSRQDATMYDDDPWADEYQRRSSPSQGHHNARKDITRSPPRGPVGNNSSYDRDNRDMNNSSWRSGRSRSPQREGRGRYLDRDREGYRSPPRNRSRSRGRSPYFGGPPSRTIILEGLPLEMTQEDISNELLQNLRVEGIEEVRLIRDKKTGSSRQFAFAQFVSISDATRLVEQYHPTVPFYGVTSADPVQVRISYSREKDDRDRPGKGEDDWRCDVCHIANYSHRALCFRCNAPRTRSTAQGVVVTQNVSGFSGFATTGDSDVSPDGTASQFVLFRGLEPGVSEEIFAKGVSKLYKAKVDDSLPPSAPAPKKTKIVSTTSIDPSLGAKEGSLRRILLIRDRKNNESWRYGFAEFNSVEDAQAAVAKYNAAEKFTISSKPVMVSYIHAGVFVPVLQVIDSELSRFTFSPLSNPSMKLMYWDEAAYVSELVTAKIEPPSLAKLKQIKQAKLAAAAANEGLASNDEEPRSKKRKLEKEPLPGAKKVVAPHLQFWTNRHAELHGITPKETGEEETKEGSVHGSTASENEPPTQSFADLQRKCCLLCSRQFKTEAEVHKHERMSQLHRDNMKKDDLVAKAAAKLEKSESAENSAYRDRAKERRQAFNQPKQPAAQHHRAPKGVPAGPAEVEEAPPQVQSKGAALLGKMGWTEGEGLGAQGTGRTEAIATDLYTQGVGLGAQGGKVGDAAEEAGRQTKSSYADFLNRTKDKAKERFESMG